MKINSNLYKQIIDRTNIYNAIYSLESYVFEKELLSSSDIKRLNDLSDKYDRDLIEGVINECKEKLERMFESDELFEITVFFKPKKINKETHEIEFRPIHSADLITQICIVSLLNQIMFDDTGTKRKLSDISRLIPSNFYGNIPSTNINNLFEPWNKKYREYSEKAIKAHKEYEKNGTYASEINLDIKKFFPSIDPIFIYDFIISKWTITSSDTDCKYLKILLEKLLFFNVKIDEGWNSVYYPKEILPKIDSEKLYYNVGIPQGLPQSYFFGNICMLIIAKEINLKFKGDAFYYVDDSIIYTNADKEEFFNNILELNQSIKESILKITKTRILNPKLNRFHSLLNYEIKIHDEVNGKSSISKISTDESLYLFAKPASAISFEIKAAVDEREDSSLLEKVNAILNVIEYKLKRTASDVDNNLRENNIKLLNSYKKFYINRRNILQVRANNEVTMSDIEKFISKFELRKDPNQSCFLSKLEDDVFIFESKSLIYRLEANPEGQKKILRSIKTFEKKLGDDFPTTNHYFSTVLENCIEFQKYKNKSYDYLNYISSKTIESFKRVNSANKNSLILSIIKIITNSNVETLTEENEKRILDLLKKYQNDYKFVFFNSPEFLRKIINALISRILNISINDSCNLIKLDNRSIYYYEVRIMMLIRSHYFNKESFTKNGTAILDELDQKHSSEKVDMSLFEILETFRLYVKDPEKIDDLIQTHKYVNGIWKNGSKFLHFYTLHNEEHSIELINNCTRITQTIDYLSIKSTDYYVLFLACYLHDISMVIYPNLNNFSMESEKTDLIYSRWKTDINEITNIEKAPKSKIKQLILGYYSLVNNYFETEIRLNHPKQSAQFIKEQSDLSFIEYSLRRLVADVSEAHGYQAKDVYKLKSKAKHDVYDEKYLMIILRLADLLDMSKDRVSINILRQNIQNMTDESKFHWISHMAIDNCTISTSFPSIDINSEKVYEIKCLEIVQINIQMNTKLLTSINNQKKCNGLLCELFNNSKTEYYLKISIDKSKQCSGKCNFSCKWITNKHKYLFDELIELKQYLDRNRNNIFKTEFEVFLKFENTSLLPLDYLDVIKEKIG